MKCGAEKANHTFPKDNAVGQETKHFERPKQLFLTFLKPENLQVDGSTRTVFIFSTCVTDRFENSIFLKSRKI